MPTNSRSIKPKKNVTELINDSIDNIESDRALTTGLLNDLIKVINSNVTNKFTHKDLGEITAKYLETLQRSNEQLVKLVSFLKKDKDEIGKFSKEEQSEMLDMISNK